MTRPLKEGLEYFPHDVDASTDEKIEILTSLYGNDGYAFYFIMLERIYRNAGCCIDISDAERREELFLILSKKMRLSLAQFEKILGTALRYNLFDNECFEQGIITSNGIQRRASVVLKKRTNMQIRYRSKNEIFNNETTEVLPEKNISAAETREETLPETPQSKVKKSKENHQSKDNENNDDFLKNDVIFKRMTDLGLQREKAKQILSRYEKGFIVSKLDQIEAKNKDQPIKNIQAYILKTFENAEFECQYEVQKKLKTAEYQRKKEQEAEAKRLKELQEEEQNRQFMEITDRLIKEASQEDRDEFYEQVIKKSIYYQQFFKKEAFCSLIVDSAFRQFLFFKNKEPEEGAKREQRGVNLTVSA